MTKHDVVGISVIQRGGGDFDSVRFGSGNRSEGREETATSALQFEGNAVELAILLFEDGF